MIVEVHMLSVLSAHNKCCHYMHSTSSALSAASNAVSSVFRSAVSTNASRKVRACLQVNDVRETLYTVYGIGRAF